MTPQADLMDEYRRKNVGLPGRVLVRTSSLVVPMGLRSAAPPRLSGRRHLAFEWHRIGVGIHSGRDGTVDQTDAHADNTKTDVVESMTTIVAESSQSLVVTRIGGQSSLPASR